jgi:hypothetical protein
MLEAHLATIRPGDETLELLVTVAERDSVDPLPPEARRTIATRLIRRLGLEPADPPGDIGRVDPFAVAGIGR